MTVQNIYKIFMLLSFLGIALAIFLLWEQFFKSSIQPCNINSNINCEAIISGTVSKTFGIPTPLIGLIGYISILVSASLRKRKTILIFSSFGLLFCLSIAYIELFKLSVVCPVCIICQSIMITIFCLSLFLNFKKN